MLQAELLEKQGGLSATIGKEVIQTGGGGGITEEELNEALDTKVDKFDGSKETGNNRFTVYAQELGEQKNIPFSQQPKDFALAQYSSGGNLKVASPRNKDDATTKEYVDDGFVAKNKRLTGNRVYVSQSSKDAEGNDVFTDNTVGYATGEQASTLALRDTSGRLYGVCTANSGAATLTTKQYVDDLGKSLAGQNEYIGSYDGTDYTPDTIQTILSDFVQATESREKRNGDLVNIVNSGTDVDYSGQQWIYNQEADVWKYYIDFENHSVIDNLNSDSAIDGLSANQGKILNDTKVSQVQYSTGQTFADGSDGGVIGRAYIRFRDNTENSIVLNCQNVKYTIPVRDSAGNFYVGNPTQAYHTVTKKYLEDNYTNEVANNVYNNTTNIYDGTAGLFMFDGGGKGGIFKSTAGGDGADRFRIKKATFGDIDSRTPSTYHDAGVGSANHCCPMTPANIDYAVKRVLLDDKLNGFVYNGVDYSWTDEEKSTVCKFLGVVEKSNTAVAVIGNSIVQRAGSGNIKVPLIPTSEDFATSKSYVNGLVTSLTATEPPTTSTVASFVGQIYLDTINNKSYQCIAIDTATPSYTWVQLIRETDYAGNSIKGVVDVRRTFGMEVDQYGRISIVNATNDEITAKTNVYHPIVPSNLDYAIVQGLTNNSITLTDEQVSAVQNWLGLGDINTALEGILGV